MVEAQPFTGPAGERQQERSFPCSSCGADLVYQPGAATLTCPYCAHVEPIPRDGRAIREFALSSYVPPAKPLVAPGSRGLTPMACSACGAQIEVPPETAARPCPCSAEINSSTSSVLGEH